MSQSSQKIPAGASVLPTLLDACEIKRRTDFVAVVSRYTRLQRCGGQLVGLCPFHPESHPSFYIEPQRKIWHCFGCNAGGDVFDFIMRIEHCRFRSAVQFLSCFCGDSARQRARVARERGGGRERGFAPSARKAGGSLSPYEAEHSRLVAKLDATERRLAAIRAANEAVPLACRAERAACESGGEAPIYLSTTG
jgi:hypothetical protein